MMVKKENYVHPTVTVISLSNELSLLSNHSVRYSPITVEDPVEDNEDNELIME
ncbi:hypothetical protein [Bacteroides heparinolyticus]|uniref:hypothetical protein n=1 Tax=Prevotella heparinolytica TaxID=28113 RepID=UPI0035A10064